MGADGTPTEQVDRAAEAQVLAVTEAAQADWNILSEEAGAIDRGGSRTLVVDPVDGSHNALRGIPAATVSLALGRGTLGGIELGVIHDLSSGATYWAARGEGAFRNGHRIHTRPWDARREMFFLNLGRHSTPRVVAWSAKGRRVRSLGCASLEMALVAEGGADAYVFENDTEARNLRVTDIAGAYRILLEAGGGVTDATSQSIDELPLDLAHHTSLFAYADPSFPQAAKERGYW